MSRDSFKDAVNAARKDNRPEPDISGSFSCMSCGERVGKAAYDPQNSLLVWWCSKDHESLLEDFDI